jgi:hypothetical protein
VQYHLVVRKLAVQLTCVLHLLGSGSEMIIDVAPGVDWTAICGIMMVVHQVGFLTTKKSNFLVADMLNLAGWCRLAHIISRTYSKCLWQSL